MIDFSTGTILALKKGFGFICPDDKSKKDNVFFHYSDLVEAQFEDLKLGQVVAYKEKETIKGIKAIKIELLLPDHMMRQLTINYYILLWHKHRHKHKNKKIN